MKIFVFPEVYQGEVKEISFEILGLAQEIKEKTGGDLHVLLAGKGVKEFVPQFGLADKILLLDNEKLEGVSPFIYQNILFQVLKDRAPELILFGHTSIGMDLAGFVALKLNFPMVAFCKNVKAENGHLMATSLICGGKILADVKIKDNKGVCLVLPGSYPAEKGKVEGTKEVEELSLSEIEEKIKFERFIIPEVEDIDITKENILVAVGRGIQNQENLEVVEELAQALGGALAASRPVVDQGWLPLTRVVGRSGKSVKPKLYLSLGISGAPEHVEGMKDAGLIIAINTDPNAPIFQTAHYGVVGDIFDIVPALVEEIKARK
ncbi:electron transfer flavoprotein subunit alpha [Candidatus Desulfofervidus auxilii]|uniref:Electron transfer flavoprotein subunit alpha n=1 Tax=Desulfofervidus auxilii TaxID=1621989 RepID=A0A7U4TJ43_DESA2|nr:electron transfer flavoprotein subunit alpha/FixB family protein [Candidatus Desulfofervidus auxilii]AMM42181.1 electron transfer flavoprotein subunit alpha [Candidatus Desulfofervidus auxilii]